MNNQIELTMSNLDSRINALLPGQEIEISRSEYGYCTVERSGDGKTIRFIRYINEGKTWSVFRKQSF